MRAFVKASSRQPRHLLASVIGLAVTSLATPALASAQGRHALPFGQVGMPDEQEGGRNCEPVSSSKDAALPDGSLTVGAETQRLRVKRQAPSPCLELSQVFGVVLCAGEGGGPRTLAVNHPF